jgi:uncharacterized membrane protein
LTSADVPNTKGVVFGGSLISAAALVAALAPNETPPLAPPKEIFGTSVATIVGVLGDAAAAV